MNTAHNTSYRFERKYMLSIHEQAQLQLLLRLHPAGFSPLYHPRQVNNIYLDTLSFEDYRENVIGVATRSKTRIRWYGDAFATATPTLERKKKFGLLGAKEQYPLDTASLGTTLTQAQVSDLFARSSLPPLVLTRLRSLRPVLLNHYQRSYFQSQDRLFRITLDTQLTYYAMAPLGRKATVPWRDNTKLIMEIKYDQQHDALASELCQHFPFRVMKSSKYLMGVQTTQQYERA